MMKTTRIDGIGGIILAAAFGLGLAAASPARGAAGISSLVAVDHQLRRTAASLDRLSGSKYRELIKSMPARSSADSNLKSLSRVRKSLYRTIAAVEFREAAAVSPLPEVKARASKAWRSILKNGGRTLAVDPRSLKRAEWFSDFLSALSSSLLGAGGSNSGGAEAVEAVRAGRGVRFPPPGAGPEPGPDASPQARADFLLRTAKIYERLASSGGN